MRIKKALVLFGMILLTGVTGCGGSPLDATTSSESLAGTEVVNTSKPKGEEVQDSGQTKDILATAQPIVAPGQWMDNTKDSYTGAYLNVFDTQNPENLQYGGSYPMVGKDMGFLFRQYFYENYADNEEFVCIGNEDGSFTELELIPEDYGLKGAVMAAGPVAGRDEFVLYIYTGTLTEYETSIAVISRDGKCIKSMLVDMPDIPNEIIMDGQGYLYCNKVTEVGNTYSVLNPEGELIIERECPDYHLIRFQSLANGEVVFNVDDVSNELASKLFKIDLETGKEKLIMDFSEFQKQNRSVQMLCTAYNGEDFILITTTGVYKWMENTEPELLYLFRNHGIHMQEVEGVYVDETEEIGIMYKTGNTTEYLKIVPTEEQREVLEIPFVMSEVNRSLYNEAIVSFNKKYPQYLISEAVYTDETQLLTELISGKGPVLVDTAYVDFEENVKLWECLEEELASIGVEDVLLDKVEEFCQIDGKQYGIVTEWGISTFACVTGDLNDWSHDRFKEYLAQHREIRSIFAEQTPTFFMKSFYFQSMESCPFWNVETDEVYFETQEFKQLLEMAERLASELQNISRSEQIEKVRSGEWLGQQVYLGRPEAFSYYNAVMGDEVQYIGYPGQNSSEHYIVANSPITIRSSATEEQKQVAVLFLEHLINYETQKAAMEQHRTLSVRKDLFEEFLADTPEETRYIIEGEDITFKVDKKKVTEQFMEIYEMAIPEPSLPAEVENILEEELQSYFTGQTTLEQACSVLQNRMQLYLYEH